MKVNFNIPFVDFKGEPIVQNGKEQVIKNVVAGTLFEGGWLLRKTGTTPEDKLAAYMLSQRIYSSEGEIDITSEEAATIREAVLTALNPGGFGQVVHLMEDAMTNGQ
jgi:hypothetical protein